MKEATLGLASTVHSNFFHAEDFFRHFQSHILLDRKPGRIGATFTCFTLGEVALFGWAAFHRTLFQRWHLHCGAVPTTTQKQAEDRKIPLSRQGVEQLSARRPQSNGAFAH